ncbi:MAG: Mth938-like domain-containing protein [Alphaproteobacteria bacterium]|nr:Mth938-like domain-containing protein [Alphaproteobacteria bacterium]MCB9929385.1 Mth938-like domain-containing protein [Alphaproteobacteria bacterium]
MADISPIIPAGRQVIETYGAGGFRITGQRYEHAVIVRPTETVAWAVSDWESVTAASLAPLFDAGASEPLTLLLGTGATQFFPSRALKQEWRAQGMVVEAMSTGAACRTYNVLMAEGRKVAAALLPVD